jgi:hypothetical protein
MQSFKLNKKLCKEKQKRQIQHVVGSNALFMRTRKPASIQQEVFLFFLHAQILIQSEFFHELSSMHDVLILIFDKYFHTLL